MKRILCSGIHVSSIYETNFSLKWRLDCYILNRITFLFSWSAIRVGILGYASLMSLLRVTDINLGGSSTPRPPELQQHDRRQWAWRTVHTSLPRLHRFCLAIQSFSLNIRKCQTYLLGYLIESLRELLTFSWPQSFSEIIIRSKLKTYLVQSGSKVAWVQCVLLNLVTRALKYCIDVPGTVQRPAIKFIG